MDLLEISQQLGELAEQVAEHATGRTVFALDYPAATEKATIAKYGAKPYRRYFSKTTPLVGPFPTPLPVMSFKVWDDNKLKAFLDTDEDRLVCWHHEAEDDIKRGDLTLPDYLKGYDKLAEYTRDMGNITIVKIGMHYQLDNQNYDWRNLDGGQVYPNLVIGVDSYFDNAKVSKGIWETPDELFHSLMEWHRETELPFAVPEFGARNAPGRELATLRAIDFLRKNGCEWACYWNYPKGGPTGFDYLIDNTPLEFVWRWAMEL